MITGKVPGEAEARALDAYLVTVCDHGLNASTFAARVVASTRAGLVSAAMGGISALKGPLHGGAPGPVLDMLDEIGVPGKMRRPGSMPHLAGVTVSWASATGSTACAIPAPMP
jgi:citrate synthase